MSKTNKNVQLLEAGETFKSNDFFQSRLTPPMQLKITRKLPKLKSYLSKLDENKRVRISILERVSSSNELLSTNSKNISRTKEKTKNEVNKEELKISLSLEGSHKRSEKTRQLLGTTSEESSISKSRISTPARGKKIFETLLKETESEMREKKVKISPSLESFYRKSCATRKLLRTISEESSVSQPQTNSSDTKKKQNASSISNTTTKLSVKNKDATQMKNNFVCINKVSSKNETSSFSFQHTSQYKNLLQQAELEMREKDLKISPSLESFYKNNEATKKLLQKISQESSISQSEVASSARAGKKKPNTTTTSDSKFSRHSNDSCTRSKHVERDDSWKLIKVVNKKYKDGTKRKEIVIEEDELSFELESLDSEDECSEMIRRISRLDACVAKEEKRAAECRGQLSVVAKLMEKQMLARLQEQKQLEDFLAEMKKQRNKLACDLGKVLRNEKRVAMRQKRREDSRRNKRIKFKSTVVELIGAGLMTAAAFAFNFI